MDKKYTVITGASSGIGYESALAFAEKGKNLILVARRKERLDSLKEHLLEKHPQLEVVVKQTDLSEKEEVYNLYESLTDYDIETWINNAGVGSSGPLVTMNINAIEQMIHINVEATAILSTLYAKDYANVQGAQLLNVSSAMGYVVALGNIAYSASKFFISSLTEGLAAELKDAPLQAKVLAPALTATDFIQNSTAMLERPLHSPKDVAGFLLKLYDSDQVVGIVNEKREFRLSNQLLPTFSL